MKYYSIIITFFIMCSACKKEAIDDFNTVKYILDFDSIFSDINEPFNSITEMECYGNILITKHAKDEFYFSIIDINQGKIIRRWGKTGRGPQEYIKLGSGFIINNSKLVFLDGLRKEINYIPISDLIKGDTINIKKEPYPYTTDFRPRHLTIIDDKKIAIGSFKKSYFGILDSSNNIIPTFFDYPFNCNDISGMDKGSIYQTKIGSNDSLNRFVIQTLASDIFEIYQITDNQPKRIFVSEFNHIPIIRKAAGRYGLRVHECIAGLTKMTTSKNYICFGYSPLIYAEAMKSGVETNEILFFDWNGKKYKKYILPFAVRTFCTDEHYIYAVRYISDASRIYRFKI